MVITIYFQGPIVLKQIMRAEVVADSLSVEKLKLDQSDSGCDM